MAASEFIGFLKQTELFQTVPDDLLERVEQNLARISLPAGSVLFNEGDIGDAVYVIFSGLLSLQSDGVQLLTRKRGECVGEFALIDDEPRSAAAVAETDMVLYKWERNSFQEMLAEDVEVARGIFRMLTGKLRQDVERRVLMVVEQERWRQDLSRAKEIQAGMLPPDHLLRPELEIAGYCHPAAEVGGDFYDYMEFDDGEVGLVIGDVTGHGFYSGLFVAMAKSCIHTQAQIAHAPAAIMRSLRRALSLSIQRRLLMTCCYVAMNLRRRVVTFANAGHPYPIHFRPSSGELCELEALDPILGALDVDAFEFEEREIDFRPGDFLVLYSDGIPEARDPEQRMFDEDGVRDCVRRCCSGSALEARDGILRMLAQHVEDAPQRDDVTLVVVKALARGEAGAS